MSYCKAAWHADVTGGSKIVLLALADIARDEHEGLCWPSVTTLTKLCGASERSVQAHLARLEADGFVTRIFRQGSRVRYQLTDPTTWPQITWTVLDSTSAEFAPPQELPPAEIADDPRKICTEPPQILQPTPADLAPIKATLTSNPKSNPKSNQENKPLPLAALAPSSTGKRSGAKSEKAKKPTRRTDDSDDAAAEGWPEFWAAYPRSDGKKAARKVWNRLAPDERLRTQMLAALALQRDSEAWRRDAGKFIPHATTWLNGERWTDVERKPGAIAAVPRTRREQLEQQLAGANAHDRMQIFSQLAQLGPDDAGDAIDGEFELVPTGPGFLPRDMRSDAELLAEMQRNRLPRPAIKASAGDEA